METVINANDPKYLLGVLKNFEREVSKAYRKRNCNLKIVQTLLMSHTNKGGQTSSYEMCHFLGIDPDAYTFKQK